MTSGGRVRRVGDSRADGYTTGTGFYDLADVFCVYAAYCDVQERSFFQGCCGVFYIFEAYGGGGWFCWCGKDRAERGVGDEFVYSGF